MRIQHTLYIVLFVFIASHVAKSCSCVQKNKKKLVKIYSEEITDNDEIEQIMGENVFKLGGKIKKRSSSLLEKVKTKNRSFLIKLEETIENCAFSRFDSMCKHYQFSNDVKSDSFMDVRFHCKTFGIVALFHTTMTDQDKKKCTIENIVSSIQINSISKTPTTNVTRFVNQLSRKEMENKMCLINLKWGSYYHAMNLEVRKNGFYIYNSWENYFSNSWFSGLTNETDELLVNWTQKKKIFFMNIGKNMD